MKCVSACPANALDSTWAMAGRNFAEKHLAKDEAPTPNPEVRRTVILAACLVFPFLVNLFMLVLLGFYSLFTYSFIQLYDSSLIAPVLLMTIAKTVVAVYMIITGIRLFIHRKDANFACTVREATGLALKFYLICAVIFVIAFIRDNKIILVWLNPLLLTAFTLLGLPFLHAYAIQLDKLIRGVKKPDFLWYLIAFLTVLISLAGVLILFAGALVKALSAQ